MEYRYWYARSGLETKCVLRCLLGTASTLISSRAGHRVVQLAFSELCYRVRLYYGTVPVRYSHPRQTLTRAKFDRRIGMFPQRMASYDPLLDTYADECR